MFYSLGIIVLKCLILSVVSVSNWSLIGVQASNCGIVESILNWVKFKAQTQLNKKCSSVKHSKIKGIPKLDDANDAGEFGPLECFGDESWHVPHCFSKRSDCL